MSGVSALSAARGALVSAPGLTDTPSRGAECVEVIESTAGDSIWALQTSWYDGGIHPQLDDWWWRRLDCFAADCDDPRILALLERLRYDCRLDEQPFECPPVVDPPASESSIVELILTTERPWHEASVWDQSNDLLVDIIHLQRSRW
jgi:hypothetical protein